MNPMEWYLVLVLVTPAGTAMEMKQAPMHEQTCRALAASYEQQMTEYSKHAGARALCIKAR